MKKLLIYLEVGLVACGCCVLLLPITFAGAVVGAVNASVATLLTPMRAPFYPG